MTNIDWCKGIELSLVEFATAYDFAGDRFQVEHLSAPHRRPSHLPYGQMAIYAFWHDGHGWLKIGKAGPSSDARFCHQHYNGCALSTLNGALRSDPVMPTFGWNRGAVGRWVAAKTCRTNILMPADLGPTLLSDLEAFLINRHKPRYEGRRSYAR